MDALFGKTNNGSSVLALEGVEDETNTTRQNESFEDGSPQRVLVGDEEDDPLLP